MVGCGASIKYTMDVDTSKEVISLDIALEIAEADYQYISGGRDQLISIINEEKPAELDFILLDDEPNKYTFRLYFNSYEEYRRIYHSITGEQSKSVFNIEGFSNISPFLAQQEIELTDDLTMLLDWLKDALINSDAIASENYDNMIQSENHYYTFNGEKRFPNNKYIGSTYIEIEQVYANILVKNANVIDFSLDMFIEDGSTTNFTEDFEQYLNDRNVDIVYHHDIVDYKSKDYNNYRIELLDIDLNSTKSIENINTVFGDGFCTIISSQIKESTIFNTVYNQYLNLELNVNSLFNLDSTIPAEVNIELEKVNLNKEYHTSDILLGGLVENGYYSTSVYTTYNTIKYPVIYAIVTTLLLVVILILKYGVNRTYLTIKRIMKMGYRLIYDSVFDCDFELKDSVIVGSHFIIDINNISKVEYGRKFEEIYKISISIILLILCFPMYKRLSKFFVCIIFIAICMYTAICYVKYRTKSLHIELTSKKEYSFVFEDKEKGQSTFIKLNELLNKEEQFNLEEIVEFVESLGE
jgi:hypothetical protein